MRLGVGLIQLTTVVEVDEGPVEARSGQWAGGTGAACPLAVAFLHRDEQARAQCKCFPEQRKLQTMYPH